MKKQNEKLLTLLIYSTGFCQVPETVQKELQKIEAWTDSTEVALTTIRDYYTPAVAEDLSARFVSPNIIELVWTLFAGDTADIRYMSPQLYERWLTVNQFYRFHQISIDPAVGSYRIGLSNEEAMDVDWRFQFVLPGTGRVRFLPLYRQTRGRLKENINPNRF